MVTYIYENGVEQESIGNTSKSSYEYEISTDCLILTVHRNRVASVTVYIYTLASEFKHWIELYDAAESHPGSEDREQELHMPEVYPHGYSQTIRWNAAMCLEIKTLPGAGWAAGGLHYSENELGVCVTIDKKDSLGVLKHLTHDMQALQARVDTA